MNMTFTVRQLCSGKAAEKAGSNRKDFDLCSVYFFQNGNIKMYVYQTGDKSIWESCLQG